MTAIEFSPDAEIRCKDYKIGCIGSGFIMADVQLMAYDEAGFDVVAIASRTQSNAQSVADRWNIPNVYSSLLELFADESVEIIDIAYPPHLQLELVREAVKHAHIKGYPCTKTSYSKF